MAALHIGWMLLNVGLMIGIGISSYRTFRLFSERYGYLPTGLLFLLTASMCQSPDKKQEQQPAATVIVKRVIPAYDQKSFWSTSYPIPLLELPTFTLSQRVYINHRSNADSVQVSSSTNLTGFVFGVQWSPMNSSVDIGTDQNIYYRASGMLEWRLLGLTVYRQLQRFDGKASFKSLGIT